MAKEIILRRDMGPHIFGLIDHTSETLNTWAAASACRMLLAGMTEDEALYSIAMGQLTAMLSTMATVAGLDRNDAIRGKIFNDFLSLCGRHFNMPACNVLDRVPPPSAN